MCGVMICTFWNDPSSISGVAIFFSLFQKPYTTSTTPFFALMPSAVSPLLTAFSAYSICNSCPFELKVVKEKSPIQLIVYQK
jgi:hypothetical protein